RRSLLVAMLAGVVAAAVAVPVFALGSSSGTPTSAQLVRLVANSVAVIDPKSNRVVADVPVGFAPRAVVAGGNRVWVLNDADQTATAIDPRTLRVVRTVGLRVTPSDEWPNGATDWVGLPGAVEMIGASATDVTTIELWKPPGVVRASFHGRCPMFVTGGAGKVWVSQGRS